MYIYLITNLVNGKQYVGQTIDLDRRIVCHKGDVKRESKQTIHCAMRKYGFEKFSFEKIDQCISSDELNEAEIEWIAILNTFRGDGYNETKGGETGNIYPRSKETIKKISEANKGEKNPFFGKTHSEENKKKMSERMKGNIPWNNGISHSEETKRKIGLKSKARTQGKNNPNYGRRGGDSQNAKHVYKICINTGDILEKFDSGIEAAKNINSRPKFIYRVCRKERKTHKGFIWRYM